MAGERAALVALVRLGRRTAREYAEWVEREGSAVSVLGRELAEPGGQASLLPVDPDPLLRQAQADIDSWSAAGFRLLTVLDPDYPPNLRTVHDRPPLLFAGGELESRDQRSVAVIGSRRASAAGLAAAARVARGLAGAGMVVVSGLAAGIDTAAHRAALDGGGRTIAVLGTGLARCYPAENRELQRRIAAEGVVLSQFWPDAPPTRRSFPQRNAVMSGLALGTVIVEASARSGALVQARQALAHGRPVFLLRGVLAEGWTRQLAGRPGVHAVDEPEQIVTTVERLNATDALVE